MALLPFLARCAILIRQAREVRTRLVDIVIYRLPPLKRFFSTRNPFIRYLNLFINTLLEAILLILATTVLTIALLVTGRMMWLLYLQTPMGKQFLIHFHEKANTINEIFLDMDLWIFGADLTLSAFLICLGICAVSYFLHLYRYFYYSLGFFKQLLFWGMPVSAVVAWYISWKYEFSQWTELVTMTALPTCCVLSGCFRYSRRLLIEAGELIDIGMSVIRSASFRLMESIRNPPESVRQLMDGVIRYCKKI